MNPNDPNNPDPNFPTSTTGNIYSPLNTPSDTNQQDPISAPLSDLDQQTSGSLPQNTIGSEDPFLQAPANINPTFNNTPTSPDISLTAPAATPPPGASYQQPPITPNPVVDLNAITYTPATPLTPPGPLSSATGEPVSTWPQPSGSGLPAASEPIPTYNPSQPSPPPVVQTPTQTPSVTSLGAPAFQPPQENAPTDLSQLMGTPTDSNPSQTPVTDPSAAETLIPPPSTQDTNQVITNGGSRGFPKWVLIVAGVIVLLAVAGGSAYFILGIGRPVLDTGESSSVPAPSLQEPTPTVTSRPLPPALPAATGSATFGNLEGVTPTGAASPSAQTGTSAIELLRQRQGAR